MYTTCRVCYEPHPPDGGETEAAGSSAARAHEQRQWTWAGVSRTASHQRCPGPNPWGLGLCHLVRPQGLGRWDSGEDLELGGCPGLPGRAQGISGPPRVAGGSESERAPSDRSRGYNPQQGGWWLLEARPSGEWILPGAASGISPHDSAAHTSLRMAVCLCCLDRELTAEPLSPETVGRVTRVAWAGARLFLPSWPHPGGKDSETLRHKHSISRDTHPGG